MTPTKVQTRNHNLGIQNQVKKLLAEEGKNGWNLAKNELLAQKTSSRFLREALKYIAEMPDYFRPALVSLCSEAVGGTQKPTLPSSAGLILFGKSIGMHDDIIDNTEKRNKRLTAYGKFGKEISLVLSDILSFKGFSLFKKNIEIGIPARQLAAIFRTIEQIWFEQAEGEIFEIQSRNRSVTTPEQILTKVKKRASECEAITRIGAILGDGTGTEIQDLGQYGRMIGTASLLRDELIDMLELDVLKARILNESLPLPIIYALKKTDARTQLEPLMKKHDLTLKDLGKISKVSDEAGGLRHVAGHINEMVKKACINARGFHGGEKMKLIANSLRIAQADWQELVESR